MKTEINKKTANKRRTFLKFLGMFSLAALLPVTVKKTAAAAVKAERRDGNKKPESPMEAGFPYLGEITCVGFNFVPTGWLPCDGRLLNISQYDTLYSLIGTTYGGDGMTTFALPNLTGRFAAGAGAVPGLTSRALGAAGGSEKVTLGTNNLPVHSHMQNSYLCSSQPGNSDNPQGKYFARDANGNLHYGPSGAAASLSSAGQGQQHNNMPPYMACNFIICWQGLFPS